MIPVGCLDKSIVNCPRNSAILWCFNPIVSSCNVAKASGSTYKYLLSSSFSTGLYATSSAHSIVATLEQDNVARAHTSTVQSILPLKTIWSA